MLPTKRIGTRWTRFHHDLPRKTKRRETFWLLENKLRYFTTECQNSQVKLKVTPQKQRNQSAAFRWILEKQGNLHTSQLEMQLKTINENLTKGTR